VAPHQSSTASRPAWSLVLRARFTLSDGQPQAIALYRNNFIVSARVSF